MIETNITLPQYLNSLVQTATMCLPAFGIGIMVGTVLALMLVLTRPGGLKQKKWLYKLLNIVINIVRPVPFIILMMALATPVWFIVGSSVGTTAAILPLALFISVYIARLVEAALLEVPAGILEAANAMGATLLQVVWHFLLPEALPSLLLGYTTAMIGLIGATATAGVIGAGGIGDIALSYGYQRFDHVAMLVAVITLIIIVQCIQSLGNRLARIVRGQ